MHVITRVVQIILENLFFSPCFGVYLECEIHHIHHSRVIVTKPVDHFMLLETNSRPSFKRFLSYVLVKGNIQFTKEHLIYVNKS